MGFNDWGELSGILGQPDVRRGVTQAFTPPVGGGSYVYGWNTMDGSVTGMHGRFVDLSTYNPLAGGGSIRGAVKRVASAANTGFSPFLFFGAQSGPPSVNDEAYILGLEDADPFRIVLLKGPLVAGVPAATDDNSLRRSSDQFQISDNLWFHLRLDVIAQPNGDVLLQVFRNLLTGGGTVQNQTWVAINGMDEYLDDVLAANSGSVPLVGGYAGFGFSVVNGVSRRGAVDHIELMKAT